MNALLNARRRSSREDEVEIIGAREISHNRVLHIGGPVGSHYVVEAAARIGYRHGRSDLRHPEYDRCHTSVSLLADRAERPSAAASQSFKAQTAQRLSPEFCINVDSKRASKFLLDGARKNMHRCRKRCATSRREAHAAAPCAEAVWTFSTTRNGRCCLVVTRVVLWLKERVGW